MLLQTFFGRSAVPPIFLALFATIDAKALSSPKIPLNEFVRLTAVAMLKCRDGDNIHLRFPALATAILSTALG